MTVLEQQDALAAAILSDCAAQDCKIACAESLTGGLFADAFVRIPGASKVFLGSAVTYDINAKASILGVDAALLEREGAVHPEVARQMAVAAARLYNQGKYAGRVMSISTTGVAGPGSDGVKPAGLVYVGVSLPDVLAVQLDDLQFPPSSSCALNMTRQTDGISSAAFELHLQGSREQVRAGAVIQALQIVRHLTVFS